MAKLQVAWTYDTRPAAVPASEGVEAKPAPRNRASQATPLMVGGVLYLSTPYNRVIAMEPETGKKIWEYESEYTPSGRGITYWGGDEVLPPQIVVGTMNGWLFTLNAKTGKLTTSFGDNGKVNLKNGVADKFPRGRYGMSSPGVIYKNLIVTGAQLQEEPANGPSGDIRAWDIHTGKLVWTFHTVPRPGERNHEAWQEDQWADRSGANSWGFMTVDVQRGMLFVPIGHAHAGFLRRKPEGKQPVRLVAGGAGRGHRQAEVVFSDHASRQLGLRPDRRSVADRCDARTARRFPRWRNGPSRGCCSSSTALTGEPIYKVEEREVLNDNPNPGDKNWPTQPFPVKPPPLARMTFQADEVAKVTPEHEAYCKGLLALEGGAIGGGPYAQYGPKLRVIFPGWVGGGNWSPPAFHPDLGYLFVTSHDLAKLE